jgi:photosystem II stability/assembly factor-like uncharacterized protein
LNYGVSYRSIDFINDQVGWIAGEGTLLKTIDGGETWDLVWKLTDSHEDWDELNSIHVANSICRAVGENGMILEYTEQDQWQLQPSITDLPLNKVYFYDQQHGWIAGGYFDEDNVYLKLFKTNDTGENWQDIPNFNHEISDMFFEDSLHSRAVGDNGLVLRTENGATWVNQNTGQFYPDKFSLSQNYPNPFNPRTIIIGSWRLTVRWI